MDNGENQEAMDMIAKSNLITKNFLHLSVEFQSDSVMEIKELPVMTWEGLAGSVGGILNLWIGVTFLTLIELVDLLISIFQGVISISDNKVLEVKK